MGGYKAWWGVWGVVEHLPGPKGAAASSHFHAEIWAQWPVDRSPKKKLL